MAETVVQYHVPTITVHEAASQNTGLTGIIEIRPGFAQEYVLKLVDEDGRKLGLVGFDIKLVFFKETIKGFFKADDEPVRQTVHVIDIPNESPHSGRIRFFLDGETTKRLSRHRGYALKWVVYLVNKDGEKILLKATDSGPGKVVVNSDLDLILDL